MVGGGLGDADDDDLALHRELSSKERLDAILEAPGLTTPQAVDSLQAMFVENQATFPHMIEAVVMVSSAPGLPRDEQFRSYVGPFADRRAAEAWATKHYAANDEVRWQALKIVTPAYEERLTAALSRIVDVD